MRKWKAEREYLRTRGAFTSIGVPGAFAYVLPEGKRDHATVASVYAEVARRFGWLLIDRVLTESEQVMLVERAGPRAADDRSLSDVLDTWGQPSAWLGGTKDLYPKTLAYAVDDREAPLICFGDRGRPNRITSTGVEALRDYLELARHISAAWLMRLQAFA
jgi:hypothetical protein